MNETPAIELRDSASGDQPPLSESGLPPLRLRHFFALTAVSAVLMSTFGPAISSFSKISFFSRYWVVLAIGGTIYTFLVAFAMTVTAYGFFWHRRAIPYPRYPGHWLLVAITASYILGFVVAAVIPEFAQNTAWFRWAWKLSDCCYRYFYRTCEVRRAALALDVLPESLGGHRTDSGRLTAAHNDFARESWRPAARCPTRCFTSVRSRHSNCAVFVAGGFFLFHYALSDVAFVLRRCESRE